MVPATILAANATTAGNNGGYYDVYEDTTVRVNEPVPETGVIEAKVVAGVATVTLNAKAVESLANLAQGGSIELEIKSEGATKVEAYLDSAALIKVAEETSADLTIKSSVAIISIPNEV